jgi:tetratricopeptide (TPR) repeat protein
MVPDLRTVMEREGLTIGDSEVEMVHLGYEGEQEHKHRRDLPLLLAAVAERPGRSYLWHRVGRAHAGLGHPSDAEAAWERGVEVVRAQDRVEPIDALVYADLVACRLRGRPDASRPVVEEMAERFPDEHLGRWASAQQAMVDGRYSDAIEPLEALASVDADALVHPCLAYDRRLFGEWAYHVLGLCWFQLGEPAAAASWLGRALQANPGEREYEVKLQLAEAHSTR